MKKKTVKLNLNRETLRDLVSSQAVRNDPNDSCVQSCYFVSCGDTCQPPLPSLQGAVTVIQ